MAWVELRSISKSDILR